MPPAQKPTGAEGAARALPREQPVAADAAAPTPANQGSASAAGAEFTDEDLQQDPLGNGDLLAGSALRLAAGRALPLIARGTRARIGALRVVCGVAAAQVAPGETWGFSKRKWGLKGGGKPPPSKQKWELKVGV